MSKDFEEYNREEEEFYHHFPTDKKAILKELIKDRNFHKTAGKWFVIILLIFL